MIIRRGERPRTWTTIPNDLIEDDRLTWEARGLLVYLLSKPDHWNVNREHLATQAPNGVRSVRTILSALEEAGYLVRRRSKGDGGRIVWECLVYDQPQTTATTGALPTDGPSADGSRTGGQATGGERAALVRTDLPSTEEARTEENPAAEAAEGRKAKRTIAERDPLMAAALEVTREHWDWCHVNGKPTPTLRLDGAANAFIAVARVVRGQLEVGWSPEQVGAALLETAAFTTNAITVALRRAHRTGPPAGGPSGPQQALADYLARRAAQ